MPHAVYIVFLFILGACIGSFLNVVVWRLPRGKSLLWPPSACPKCNHQLGPKDNIPVFGWILLCGKCRYCGEPVSARYPIIEAITGLLFVLYYVAFYMLNLGPSITTFGDFGDIQHQFLTTIEESWAIYGLCMLLISALLAASLIDAELYIIPIEIPWVVAVIAFLVHALIAKPDTPGTLSAGPVSGAMALGIAVGLLLANLLLWVKVLPRSFPQGEPILDFEREELERQLKEEAEKEGKPVSFEELPPVASKGEIRREILKEVLFVAIPVVLAVIAPLVLLKVGGLREWWLQTVAPGTWSSGLLGSLWGAIVAAGLIWIVRIGATLALGRVAMGQGDTHLMVAIGAVMGAGPAVAVFFLAPFCGIVIGIYKWVTHGKHELPYGPYLSLAAGVVLLGYRFIFDQFGYGAGVVGQAIASWFGM